MARRSAGRKAYRFLDFITGLDDPDVRAALAGHGFSDAELDAGWDLLRGLGRARRAAEVPGRDAPSAALRPLDEWENRWFVVADASLAANHPSAHAWLFHELTRQSGMRVVLSVTALVRRIRQLEAGVEQLGSEAKAARALLERRGLTERVLTDVENQLSALERFEPSSEEPSPVQSVEEAEASMWAWYLEWSRIARAVIDEPRLLSHLGLGKAGRPRKGE